MQAPSPVASGAHQPAGAVPPQTRFVCIHGHFYQPPRENPWLEEVELQDAAYPYHDWNERITAECYEPNASARILDRQGHIARIISNYERTSWNFGPTLLSWLQLKAPRVYRAILDADAKSRARFSGHGSAIAQAYSHLIMPLASRRDKATQVRWGLADFQHRFGRPPEGMWLPEAAVDLESLDLLAEHGIAFTILAPHQARAVRRTGSGDWQETAHGSVDPTMPYRVNLPSGRSIAVFFYDGPISRAVAFERLLDQGDFLAGRLLGALPPWPREHDDRPRLVHIATDGETYGHHHAYGEMALAYALEALGQSSRAQLTNYGEFLARNPPTHEAQIVENTSWSCAHGVERWRADCGCNSGGRPGWHQRFRKPLRAALDALRDQVGPRFEHMGAELFRDPWAARDGYIDVILDRSPASRARFLERHARAPLTADGRTTAWKLLEMQRHAQLMYTSCGWFFDDIAGPEPAQDIQYAGRVVQLAQELFGEDFETPFLALLAQAPGNTPELPDGRAVYEKAVRPEAVDLQKVGAHFAMSSLLRGPEARVRCYRVEESDTLVRQSGRLKLGLGRLRVTSDITEETADLCYGALHLGDHNLSCGVRAFPGDGVYQQIRRELLASFLRADVPEVLRALDAGFGQRRGGADGAAPAMYSLRHVFRDDQRQIVRQILNASLAEVETELRHIYERNAPLMRFLAGIDVPQPRGLRTAADFALHQAIRRALDAEPPDVTQAARALDEAEQAGVRLESAALGFAMAGALERLLDRLQARPLDIEAIERLEAAVRLAESPPLLVNLWRTQNGVYALLEQVYAQRPDAAAAASAPPHVPPAVDARLRALADLLRVRACPPAPGAG